MPKLEKNKHYIFLAARITPLLLGDETNEEFSVMKSTIVKGLEPPMHRFENANELWKVLDGEITFQFEDKTQEVTAGDTIFIPKQTMHTFQLKTNTATAIFAVTSADYEAIAAEFARPATDENELPDAPPTMEQVQAFMAFSANHGLTFQMAK